MSLRNKLLITLVPVIVILFCFIVFAAFEMSRNIILYQIRQEGKAFSMYYASEFASLLNSAQKTAEGMANVYEIAPSFAKKNIEDIIRNTLQKNPEIYGSTLSLLPKETPLGLYAPYYYRNNSGGFIYRSLISPSYDYINQNWFTEPINQKRGVWSEPYFDKGGGDILMVTYSVPVIREGKVTGVATVDVSLESLVKKLKTLQLSSSGYGFIVSKKGYLVANPMMDLLSKESIFDTAKTSNIPDLKRFSDILQGNKGAVLENFVDPFTNKLSCMAISPIGNTDWDIVIIETSKVVFAPLAKLRTVIIITSIIVILLLVWLIFIITGKDLSPISDLVKQTERFAQGHFDARLDEKKGTLEIQKLSQAFNVMGYAIEVYINKLTEEQKKRAVFLATISHELMTPMTMISGYTDLLKEELTETQNETTKEYLDVLGKESTHLNMLIYDLFVVNDIADVGQQLNYANHNVGDILKKEVEYIKKKEPPHNISFTIKDGITDKQLTACVDRDKLAHCFAHILDNAVKFSPEGGDIIASIGVIEKDGRKMIEAVIEDHGIGIPVSEYDKIFDKFYQVDMSSTRKFEGLGNGLFICKKIITAHKGELYFESVAEKGSKFYVILPINSQACS